MDQGLKNQVVYIGPCWSNCAGNVCVSRPWWCTGFPRENAKTRKRARKYESAKAGQLHTDFNGMSSGMLVHVMWCKDFFTVSIYRIYISF
jgi:hypothetical protein